LETLLQFLCNSPEINLTLDISRMRFGDSYFDDMEPAMQKAFSHMSQLENGSIANPDENRWSATTG
jgi:glucose-6-phosphate isomerase